MGLGLLCWETPLEASSTTKSYYKLVLISHVVLGVGQNV